MRENDFAYISGSGEEGDFPLQNFLPPFSKDVCCTWVRENQLEESCLIDPISANPMLAVALAQNGWKVIAARSNPINWLVTELLCEEGIRDRIRAATNKLLISRKDDQSLEDILKPIYMTTCGGCGNEIQAEGFVWEKGSDVPFARVYSCPSCGDAGEREISHKDLTRLEQLGKLDIHLSRALQMVNPGQAYEKESILEALSCYPPRALYVCMLLVNRFEYLEMDKGQRKFLRAALLTVFNDAHALRHWPIRQYRFLQFAVPQRYFEKNLYLSLTTANARWPETHRSIPVSSWPNLPPESGGICFFQTRLAENKQLFEDIPSAAVLTTFPRPGQTYWTLSAIWSGWLWGKNAVKPIRSALRRRRYGWYWYAKAIQQSAQRIHIPAAGTLRFFGLFPFYTPNLAFGLFAGMQKAGFILSGAAFREGEELLQAEWKNDKKPPSSKPEEIKVEEILSYCLQGINEPIEFQEILMHVVIQASLESKILGKDAAIEEDDYSQLNRQVSQIIEKPDLLMYGSTDTQAARKYLLHQPSRNLTPLSERIESHILELLQHVNEISSQSIDRLTCLHFKGHQTPRRELIQTIIQSYAKKIGQTKDTYQLHEAESPKARQEDLQEISELIQDIGNRIGLAVKQDRTLTWSDRNTGEVLYEFFISLTADLSKTLLAATSHENAQHVFVYPASRSALIHQRFQQDFRLPEALTDGWHLVKFRHIRRLAERELITIEVWKDLIDSDPPMREAPAQLKII
jgi:hypothetical protein